MLTKREGRKKGWRLKDGGQTANDERGRLKDEG
jgi:hypothetical protein